MHEGSSGLRRWAPSPFLSSDSLRDAPTRKRLPLPSTDSGVPERRRRVESWVPPQPEGGGVATSSRFGLGEPVPSPTLPRRRRRRSGSCGGRSGGRTRGGAGEEPRRWRPRRRQVWTGRRCGSSTLVRARRRPWLWGRDGLPGGASRAASTCAQLGARPGTRRFHVRRPEEKDARPLARTWEERRRPEGGGGWGAGGTAAPAWALPSPLPSGRPRGASALQPDPQVSEELAGSGAGALLSPSWEGASGPGTRPSAPGSEGRRRRRAPERGCCGRVRRIPGTAALALRRTDSSSCPNSRLFPLAGSPKSQVRSLPLNLKEGTVCVQERVRGESFQPVMFYQSPISI